MAQQTVGVGTTANDGTGDTPRTTGQKVNANFTELYAAIASLTSSLAGKANTSHTQTVSTLSDATADAKVLLQSYANTDFATSAHTHILSDVDELVDALASKYDSSHVGTTANKLVQLTAAAKLPAVDGSLLTGFTSAFVKTLLNTLPTSDPSVVGEPWIDENGFVKQSLGTTNLYQVSGWSDSNYFASAAGAGITIIGTIRLVGKLLAVPASGLKVLLGRADNSSGWYVGTGLIGAGTLDVVGSPTEYATVATMTTDDIGRVFTIHATISGGYLNLYLGGMFVQRIACTPIASAGGTSFYVGRLGVATGYAANDIAIIDFATSTSAMTAQQIYDDAVIIQNRTTGFRIEDLASQANRWNADDIASTTNWASQTGSMTLTRNGTLTVEAY